MERYYPPIRPSCSGPTSTTANLQQLKEHLEALPRLEVLEISGSNVTDEGLEYIAGLKET